MATWSPAFSCSSGWMLVSLLSSHLLSLKLYFFITDSFALYFIPLNPRSDKHLISPNSITLSSNIKVIKVKEMITMLRSS